MVVLSRKSRLAVLAMLDFGCHEMLAIGQTISFHPPLIVSFTILEMES